MSEARIVAGMAAAAVTVLAGATAIFGSWYTVDEGERGVLTRNGAVIGVATPGLGFKLPLVDDVEKISVRTEIATFDELAAYSRDQQPAVMRVSVNYRILPDQVTTVYSSYGNAEALAERLIHPRVFEELKTVFGQYTAVSAVQSRDKLNLDARNQIAEAVKGPVVIEGVQIENIDFSSAYEESIEQRMLAEVEVQRLHQNAEREKVQQEITVTQARAQAESRRLEADAHAYSIEKQAAAEAESVRLRGEAEASALRAKGAALKDNPTLIELRAAELWDGKLPVTMVPGAAVPFLSVK